MFDASNSAALLLACPVDDIQAAVEVQTSHGVTLIPAGAVGDLDRCGLLPLLYLLEIRPDEVAPAATWSARLLTSVALTDPDPADLLPSTWTERHPQAYSVARSGRRLPAGEAARDDFDPDDEEVVEQQVFLPVAELAPLPKHQWLFTNELVPKQARGGRKFAPRAPTMVTPPD